MRGAWIEISRKLSVIKDRVSLPVRGAWIEIIVTSYTAFLCNWSLPVGGAWIEISSMYINFICQKVAPCEGSVD